MSVKVEQKGQHVSYFCQVTRAWYNPQLDTPHVVNSVLPGPGGLQLVPVLVSPRGFKKLQGRKALADLDVAFPEVIEQQKKAQAARQGGAVPIAQMPGGKQPRTGKHPGSKPPVGPKK